jgi:hypothetical protein
MRVWGSSNNPVAKHAKSMVTIDIRANCVPIILPPSTMKVCAWAVYYDATGDYYLSILIWEAYTAQY